MPNYYISYLHQKDSNPSLLLNCEAARQSLDILSKHFAQFMDKSDPLAGFRQRFSIPQKSQISKVSNSRNEILSNANDNDECLNNNDVTNNDECIYLCGNSLGLKPHSTTQVVIGQLQKWEQMGVEMHFHEPLPAASCDLYGRDYLAQIVGATPSEVAFMNGLTVNLHLLMISFYQPTASRYKILIEEGAFPSDRYAMRSQAEIRGFDPDETLLEIGPRPGEDIIRDDDIIELIMREGESIAVVCLSGVQYYTGQKFNMGAITAAAHEKECYVGWDLAHAVGNVELCLNQWDVDFACWCTYKYLNSGPGCIAGAYINARHKHRNIPHLEGWWSNKAKTRFQMRNKCDLSPGIDGFKLSNPSPIMVGCVIASLEIFDEAGMDRLREKQLLLTGYLELLLDYHLKSSDTSNSQKPARIITPRDPNSRGCQISLEFSFPVQEVYRELQRRGMVCDMREPSALRIAPAPLYNSFQDVYTFVMTLKDVIHDLCYSKKLI